MVLSERGETGGEERLLSYVPGIQQRLEMGMCVSDDQQWRRRCKSSCGWQSEACDGSLAIELRYAQSRVRREAL